MTETYEWRHQRPGERERLDLMSANLDPWTLRHMSRIPIASGWRCLEIGAGNGSVSAAIAPMLGPSGLAVASDLETSFLHDVAGTRNLETRKIDIVTDDIGQDRYDLVFVRALLHHLPQRRDVVAKMVRAVRPGGFVYIEEPDFYPTWAVEPDEERKFWIDFLTWARHHKIDYYVGRRVAPWLDELGQRDIYSDAHTSVYNGGSPFARWWQQSIAIVADDLLAEAAMTEAEIDAFMGRYDDPHHWTMSIAFTATISCKP